MFEGHTFEIIGITLWTAFIIYATWYFTSAKHYAPITSNEAKILWKIHKQLIHCNGKKWRELKRGSKIIGFECECGHKHIQRRPLVIKAPTLRNNTETYADANVYLLNSVSSTRKST
ncbi:MAG TPA: hypothetical protein VMT26_06780 [Candidatus Bathyarchaeia archaeon]|nr:hypothetical protein [Candidatus Bathyarchaeia archaeon]